jgi:hypothetical protein
LPRPPLPRRMTDSRRTRGVRCSKISTSVNRVLVECYFNQQLIAELRIGNVRHKWRACRARWDPHRFRLRVIRHT